MKTVVYLLIVQFALRLRSECSEGTVAAGLSLSHDVSQQDLSIVADKRRASGRHAELLLDAMSLTVIGPPERTVHSELFLFRYRRSLRSLLLPLGICGRKRAAG
ncbi:hypothetical protein EYF80_031211 [Liparis tanakae]|uniref:Uncharacterized protein n=1 Tax=Liparis tanakae TaxID=230148 RepID=A0A4Z2GZ61_9TELE|nr:hypothetical protein EYF80_031211 [Liparis tanakae]